MQSEIITKREIEQNIMNIVESEIKQELKNTFGYENFRPLQEEIISRVLKKKDTLVIMPTGGGKSLCYQIPALLFQGLTIVVSPLISLMKDQVEQLRENGINAALLNSSLSPEAYGYNERKVMQGKAKLLYVAPETLLMKKTKKLLEHVQVDCFTIDEAHCISEWGHDFRPEYRQLAEVRKEFPEAVSIALTATATPRVREDIKKTLKLRDSEEFIASFDRKNLFLQITDKKDPLNQVLDFLYTRKNQSGIIYCFSRRQVDELAYELEQNGYNAKPYHAGLSDRDRAINQRSFIKDDVQIIVATIAFGMGINKPNVRFVIHYDMPQNIESYYQQIGRAGRDGLRSDCVLLYSSSDTQKIKYFINKKEGREKEVAEEHLEELLKFINTTSECRRKPLMRYFGEEYKKEECGMCDNCISAKDGMDEYTIPAQKFLSCMIRTGEMFGKTYIIDVLRGSKQKKILENNHQEVSTYGIGKEWGKAQWDQLARLLIRQDYILKNDKGGLRLTENGREVLNGNKRVFGLLDRTSAVIGNEAAGRTTSDVETKYDEKLFDILREKRKELADVKGIPPTSIFSDTTLMEMSYYYPMSKGTLSNLYGVGTAKLNNYGDVFIGLIKRYAQHNQVEEREKRVPKKAVKSASSEKHKLIGDAFNKGQSIEHLAEEYGVKDVTILNHLKTYMTEGNELREDGILEHCSLSERQQDEVMQSFKKVGPDLLKPVYEDLNKAIGYDQLRIMQLYYKSVN